MMLKVLQESWLCLIEVGGDMYFGVTTNVVETLDWSFEMGKGLHITHLNKGDKIQLIHPTSIQDAAAFIVENYPDIFEPMPSILSAGYN